MDGFVGCVAVKKGNFSNAYSACFTCLLRKFGMTETPFADCHENRGTPTAMRTESLQMRVSTAAAL